MYIYEAVVTRVEEGKNAEVLEVVGPFLAVGPKTAKRQALVDYMRQNPDASVSEVRVTVQRFC